MGDKKKFKQLNKCLIIFITLLLFSFSAMDILLDLKNEVGTYYYEYCEKMNGSWYLNNSYYDPICINESGVVNIPIFDFCNSGVE